MERHHIADQGELVHSAFPGFCERNRGVTASYLHLSTARRWNGHDPEHCFCRRYERGPQYQRSARNTDPQVPIQRQLHLDARHAKLQVWRQLDLFRQDGRLLLLWVGLFYDVLGQPCLHRRRGGHWLRRKWGTVAARSANPRSAEFNFIERWQRIDRTAPLEFPGILLPG